MAGYSMLRSDIPTPKCWDEELTNIEQIEVFNKVKSIANFTPISDSQWTISRPVPKAMMPIPFFPIKDTNTYKGKDTDMFKENPGFDMYVFMWRWVNGLCPDCGATMEWDEGDKSLVQQCSNFDFYNGCKFIDEAEVRNYYFVETNRFETIKFDDVVTNYQLGDD